MEQEPKQVSPLIAWPLIALTIGISSFAFWYYYQRLNESFNNPTTNLAVHHATTATSTSATKTAPTTTDLTYTNSTYGFTMTFPAAWKGYKFKEATLDGITKTYYVEVPTTDSSFTASQDNDAGYYSAFAISVYTLAQWNAVVAAEGPHDTLITKNNTYAFGWSLSNGQLASDFSQAMRDQVATIIASFKLQ